MLPKRFQKYVMIACLTIPCIRDVGAAETSYYCDAFTAKQLDVLQSAYDYGKPYDLGFTMAAIAWKESSAGERLANWNDPSFGVYHVLLKNAANSEGFNPDKEPLRAASVASRLMYDHDYAANEALKVIKYWFNYHEGNYLKTWASYNAGWSWKGAKGQAYTNDILKKVRYLNDNYCLVL